MKKDEIFFGNEGLTSTSANYIANLAKESYMHIDNKLNKVRFFTTRVKLIGNNIEDILKKGVDSVDNIKDDLDRIAKLKSLIAWLREAIKAKERLLSEARLTSYEDLGIEVPECPVRENYITVDDVISTWDIKKRNRYYYLETLCAEIGSYIHPDGYFSNERKSLANAINEPNSIAGSGRDAMMYSYEPSLNPDDVENLFMDLQNTYRTYQAELNSMKHSIEMAIADDKRTKDAEFTKKYEEYSETISKMSNTLVDEINDRTAKVNNLKIIIPDSLKPIYSEIQKLGKK